MDKKILIYFNEYHLKPKGGPAGYLYNLKKGLDKENITNISFIPGEDTNKRKKEFLHKLPKFLQRLYYFTTRIKERRFLIGTAEKKSKIDLNKYEFIHFHSTIDLYKCKDSLNDYKGKIILTSHCPKPMFLEKYEDGGLFKIEKILTKKKYLKNYSDIDEYAFDRADYILFPCEEAEEPYYNNWERYKEIKLKNKDKYRYLLTGIDKSVAKIDKTEYRKEHNISEDAFVISYAGRHNNTKGYDTLKSIGKELLENEKNYFLIAGKEEPIKGLKHEHWIEVGWTKDPHSLINASDVFILPNKETYFDLIMLEVLSLGKIVIASNTGGNKFFEKIGAEGIFLYNSQQELIELIRKISDMEPKQREILESKNRELFNNYFTKEIFIEKYIEILEKL